MVGSGVLDRHPPTRSLAGRLRQAGHTVDVVGGVPKGGPRRPVRADLVYPATRGDVPLAERSLRKRAKLVAPPAWGPTPAVDVAWVAPAEPRWSSSPAGAGLPLHLRPAEEGTGRPREGRHAGLRLGLVHRSTSTSPARYLTAALGRAGVDVVALEALDWARLAGVDAVVVVESPLPAFVVSGANPGVPVLLWAHHGEHHTAMHLRLVDRYGVDAVLLAHSWHLAHRFGVPVHRLPFGIPTELVDGSRPWDHRRLDAAFVGAGTGGGGAYTERGAILTALAGGLGRVEAATDVTPEEMAARYADARIVPNEGGVRHRPITMRVFEAIGSGALLLTAPAPGLDRLFTPGEHLVVVEGGPDRFLDTAKGLLAGAGGRRIAEAGHAHGLGAHTTDHRVDDLVAVVATTRHRGKTPPTPPTDPLAAAVADDALIDDVIVLGEVDTAGLEPSLVVWGADRLERPTRPLAHAIVVGPGWEGDGRSVVEAARRLVVAHPGCRDILDLAARVPGATVAERPGAVVVDLGVAGYKVGS